MKTVLVTVIVPIYNRENSISKTIKSLTNQSYENIEIILINDGSSDKSGEICNKFERLDNRIIVINKKNEGVSVARNIGIENASGEYILFVDSDDYVEKNYCQKFLEAKEKFSDIKNIWCGFQIRSDDYKKNKQIYVFDKELEYSLTYRTKIMTLHEKWLDTSVCNKFYIREVITENNIKMKENLCLGEDLLFNLEYLDAIGEENILVINSPLYNYVKSETESLDNCYRENFLEIIKMIHNELFNYGVKFNVDSIEMKKFYTSYFYKLEVAMQNTFDKKNSEKFFKKIKINNEILNSRYFNETLKKSNVKINNLYKFAYKKKHYEYVIVLDFLVKLKNFFNNLIGVNRCDEKNK